MKDQEEQQPTQTGRLCECCGAPISYKLFRDNAGECTACRPIGREECPQNGMRVVRKEIGDE